MSLLPLLVPTASDLGSLAMVALVAAAFIGLGRAACGRETPPELALLAGWGVACLTLTLWGCLTALSLFGPGALLLLGGLAALAVRPRGRADRGELARMALLSLPLWLVMASARPSLPDTFTNFWPNAVGLFDTGLLPADGRPDFHSAWPALPYSVSFVGFLVAMPFAWLERPVFPPAALSHVTVLLLLAVALAFARALTTARPIGWRGAALGFLAVTVLNPGFVPKFDLSSYGDGPTMGLLAVLAWLGLKVLEDGAARWQRRAFGLVLAAAFDIRESNIALVGMLLGALFLLGAADRRIGAAAGAGRLLGAAWPGLLTLAVWRWFVATHFVEGELMMPPMADWRLAMLAPALGSAAKVVWEKPVFFLPALAVLIAGLRALRRPTPEPWARLAALFALVWLGWLGFLGFIYSSHFVGELGQAAHSFFRYNTHVALLLVMAIGLWAAPRLGRSRLADTRVGARVGAVLVSLALILPLAFVERVRFDLAPPYPLVAEIAARLSRSVKDHDRVTLLLPGDNASLGFALLAHLTLGPGRHRPLTVAYAEPEADGTLPPALATEPGVVFVSCAARIGGEGEAVVLRADGTRLVPVDSWRYPTSGPDGRRWTPAIAAAPLCADPATNRPVAVD